MSALTESEIFACLSENFRLAVQYCEDLARLPKKGPTYLKLRESLKLLEGACRQAAYWRSDARWFRLGLMMEEAHKRAGSWLRGADDGTGQRVKLAAGHLHPLFVKLADNLRKGHLSAEQLRHKKTGRIGPILPAMPSITRIGNRPVQVSKGGIILPNSVRAA